MVLESRSGLEQTGGILIRTVAECGFGNLQL